MSSFILLLLCEVAMGRARRDARVPGQLTLSLPAATYGGPTPDAAPPTRQRLLIPVDPTFDASQGIRDARVRHVPPDLLEVVFDGRHLELAEQNVRAEPDPDERFVGDQGGIVNLAVFLNVLRCYGALAGWHLQELGQHIAVDAVPPRDGSRACALWDALGMEEALAHIARPPGPQPLFDYHSRYVSPILLINRHNRKEMLEGFAKWIDRIEDRLGSSLTFDLIATVPEIMTNLVRHGLAGGALIVSVWPTGQVEILWSNRISELADWPAEDTAKGLAEACQNRDGGGAGMAYILDQLLPTYAGVLAVNFRGNDVIFSAGRYVDIRGQGRRSDAFLPRSVLFSLELFSPDVRERSNP